MAEERNIEPRPIRSETTQAGLSETTVTRGLFPHHVSWGAIFAGLFIALVSQIVLTILGVAIGLSVITPDTSGAGGASAGQVASNAAWWWVVTSIIALFFGGWVAGRMAGLIGKTDAALHGLVTWGLTGVATIILLSLGGGAVAGGWGVLGSPGTNMSPQRGGYQAGPGGMSRQPSNMQGWQNVSRELQDLASGQAFGFAGEPGGTTQPSAQSANPQASAAFQNQMRQLLQAGEPNGQNFDRQAAINLVMTQTGQSREQAERTVDRLSSQYYGAAAGGPGGILPGQAKTPTGNAASAAWWAFIAVVLGGVSAFLGGWFAPKADELRTTGVTTTTRPTA